MQVVGAVDAGLRGEDPAVDVLDGAVAVLNCSMMRSKAISRDALGEVRVELAGVEILARHQPDLREARDRRRIRRRRRVGLHQLRQQREIVDRIHPVHLVAHRGLHVDRRVDLARRRRVGLAIGAERHEPNWSCSA